MNIAIIGFGKMGKEIEKIALRRGHTIGLAVDVENQNDKHNLKKLDIQVAIEFTTPQTAFENIKTCIDQGIPVISGTTGWLENFDQMEAYCQSKNGAFFYASNYSLGVNLFFKLNAWLGRLMGKYPGFQVEINEAHHTQKLDKPSGTAITLAEQIIVEQPNLDSWISDQTGNEKQLTINSVREKDLAGTHTISYDSPTDKIEITHFAKSREGFALGAVLVAEWIVGKTGVFSMDDFLNIN